MSDSLNVLTAADITAILSNSRVRGGDETFIRNFVESGELYAIVNEHPSYKAKTAAQMVSKKNQMTMKAKALGFANVKLVKADDNILIVNTDLLAEQSEDSDEDE